MQYPGQTARRLIINHSALLILTLTTDHCFIVPGHRFPLSEPPPPSPDPRPRVGTSHSGSFLPLRNTFTCHPWVFCVLDPRAQSASWRLQKRMTSLEDGDGRGWSLFPPSLEEQKKEGVDN